MRARLECEMQAVEVPFVAVLHCMQTNCLFEAGNLSGWRVLGHEAPTSLQRAFRDQTPGPFCLVFGGYRVSCQLSSRYRTLNRPA
jgi:hypothetical protein